MSLATDDHNGLTIQVELSDGCLGYVVIDTTVSNSSVGGLRIAEDLTLEEVAVLAREMTLKFAFIGLFRGGAKAGLRLSAGMTSEKKRSLLFEFGRRVGPILRRGLFYPAPDMNCSLQDLRAVYAGAGLPVSPSRETALFTAITTLDALAACRELVGNPRRRLRLAIEGFGHVARRLAQRLPSDQYAIMGISTVQGAVRHEDGFDAMDLAEKQQQFGDDVIHQVNGFRMARESLFEMDVDIFIPAARIWSITAETAARLRARFVVPIANAPYRRDGVPVLEGRGTICLPGFVVNSGGVFGAALSGLGVPVGEIERVSAQQFRAVVRALLKARLQYGVWPTALAEQVALQRLRGRGTSVGVSRHQRVARRLVERLFVGKVQARRRLRQFARNLAGLEELVLNRGHTLKDETGWIPSP